LILRWRSAPILDTEDVQEKERAKTLRECADRIRNNSKRYPVLPGGPPRWVDYMELNALSDTWCGEADKLDTEEPVP
jgi:hypothetical protein